jgi:hypothetical protein
MPKRRVLPAGFIEQCIPVLAHKSPAGSQWVHEIKHEGYRLIVRRDGDPVRLFTRRGYDWSPWWGQEDSDRETIPHFAAGLGDQKAAMACCAVGCSIAAAIDGLVVGANRII